MGVSGQEMSQVASPADTQGGEMLWPRQKNELGSRAVIRDYRNYHQYKTAFGCRQDGLMNRIWRACSTVIYIIALISLNGCGLLAGGTWEDDTDNWRRAFQSTQPDNVVVSHSKYWRSSHWTYEFEYFFEIEANGDLKDQLYTQNKLVELQGQDAVGAKSDFFSTPPVWFAPKAVDKYEVWVYEDRKESNFCIFIDKETGTLFLTDYLV
jgi:hypothetical protein